MGVYISNIKKPKHCTECYFVCRDQCELQDNSYDYDTFKEQKKHCPLIEIDLVRCGECKWWENDGNIGYCHAEKHFHFTKNWEISIYRKYKADHYCSDGKRRDDERTTE